MEEPYRFALTALNIFIRPEIYKGVTCLTIVRFTFYPNILCILLKIAQKVGPYTKKTQKTTKHRNDAN